jgi:chaperonin cofactor prefoldin
MNNDNGTENLIQTEREKLIKEINKKLSELYKRIFALSDYEHEMMKKLKREISEKLNKLK